MAGAASRDDRDKGGETALMAAAAACSEACVWALLGAGADPNARDQHGQTALMRSAEKGGDACVDALIRAGADVSARDDYGRTALMLSAELGHYACVVALIDSGRCADADPRASQAYAKDNVKRLFSDAIKVERAPARVVVICRR